MIIIKKEPVPMYETKCYECKSVIRYKKSEARSSFITCPVCGVSIWADTTFPIEYYGEEQDAERRET